MTRDAPVLTVEDALRVCFFVVRDDLFFIVICPAILSSFTLARRQVNIAR
jgi:hypothetical protein